MQRGITAEDDAPPPRPEIGAGRAVIDLGVAGASAQREYDRREGRRRARVSSPVPLAVRTGAGAGIGAMIATFAHASGGLWVVVVLFFAGVGALKVLDTPQHIDAWRSGAAGERAVGAALDALHSDGVLTVHDRRVPGSRTNIDHIAVSPSGVFVVDAKNVAGKVSVTGSGLRVAGRRRDEMVPGVLKQVDVVRRALVDQHLPDGTVRGVLCFTRANLPWLRPAPGGVQLLYRKGLARLLRRPGPFGPEQVRHLATLLAQRLPRA